METTGLKIYPNPTVDKVQIEGLSSTTPTQIKIYDILGKMQMSRMVTKKVATVDLSSLPAGMYTITIDDGNKVTSHKVLKK